MFSCLSATFTLETHDQLLTAGGSTGERDAVEDGDGNEGRQEGTEGDRTGTHWLRVKATSRGKSPVDDPLSFHIRRKN